MGKKNMVYSVGVVTEVHEDVCKVIEGIQYNSYTVEIDKTTIQVFINSRITVSVGEHIQLEDIEVVKGTTFDIALLARTVKVIPAISDSWSSSCFKVTFNGCIYKPDTVALKYVGANRAPFIPCTLKINTCENESVYLLMVAFDDLAQSVSTFDKLTDVTGVGVLKQRRDGMGYEINCKAFTVVE